MQKRPMQILAVLLHYFCRLFEFFNTLKPGCISTDNLSIKLILSSGQENKSMFLNKQDQCMEPKM